MILDVLSVLSVLSVLWLPEMFCGQFCASLNMQVYYISSYINQKLHFKMICGLAKCLWSGINVLWSDINVLSWPDMFCGSQK
jgi:hypothetical protein